MIEIYEYQVINISLEPIPNNKNLFSKPTIVTAANRWAAMGWRTVAVLPSQGPSYADAILIERKRETETFEQNIREDQARIISKDLREEFPPSDVADYIDREFGGKLENDD